MTNDPMRYAIITDVHANLEALTEVLSAISNFRVDRIFSLGDQVGYNANPNECVEILRERDIPCLMGNHDSRAAGLKEPLDFNPLAEKAILWTREQLKEENKFFLKRLPEKLLIDESFLLVHGSITDPDYYIFSFSDVLTNFNLMVGKDIKICFFGHTHVRKSYCFKEGTVTEIREKNFLLDPSSYYLINPGSVGQPRDGDPRASFLVFDTEKREISLFRVAYDIETAAKKILQQELPPYLAHRLFYGQ